MPQYETTHIKKTCHNFKTFHMKKKHMPHYKTTHIWKKHAAI